MRIVHFYDVFRGLYRITNTVSNCILLFEKLHATSICKSKIELTSYPRRYRAHDENSDFSASKTPVFFTKRAQKFTFPGCIYVDLQKQWYTWSPVSSTWLSRLRNFNCAIHPGWKTDSKTRAKRVAGQFEKWKQKTPNHLSPPQSVSSFPVPCF